MFYQKQLLIINKSEIMKPLSVFMVLLCHLFCCGFLLYVFVLVFVLFIFCVEGGAGGGSDTMFSLFSMNVLCMISDRTLDLRDRRILIFFFNSKKQQMKLWYDAYLPTWLPGMIKKKVITLDISSSISINFFHTYHGHGQNCLISLSPVQHEGKPVGSI